MLHDVDNRFFFRREVFLFPKSVIHAPNLASQPHTDNACPLRLAAVIINVRDIRGVPRFIVFRFASPLEFARAVALFSGSGEGGAHRW